MINSFKREEEEKEETFEGDELSVICRIAKKQLERGMSRVNFEFSTRKEISFFTNFLKTRKFEGVKSINLVKGSLQEEDFNEFVEALQNCPNVEVLSIEFKQKIHHRECSTLFSNFFHRTHSLRTVKFSSSTYQGLEIFLEALLGQNHVEKLFLHRTNCFSEKAEQLLLKILEEGALKELDIDWMELPNPEMLMHSVEKSKKLQSISYKYYYTQRIGSFPIGNKNLTSIALGEIEISRNVEQEIGKYIAESKSLTLLKIKVHKSFIINFFESLNKNSSLRSLSLEDSGLDSESVPLITELLQSNTNLSELNLSWNYLKDSCKEIFVSLKYNTHLTSIDLSKNGITLDNAAFISEMLLQNKKLTNLNISRNPIEEGMLKIFDSLKTNNTLKTFLCNLTMRDYYEKKEISQMLRENCSLTRINCCENWIGIQDAKKIFEALSENENLQELAIDYIDKENQVNGAVCSLIRRNRTLQKLNFFQMLFSVEGIRDIADALQENFTLIELNLTCVEKDDSKVLLNRTLEKTFENEWISEADKQAKLIMMILQRRRDGNIVSHLPRRLLIQMLTFLEKVNVRRKK